MYLIFAYTCYYPHGGWNDFEGTMNSYKEALAFAKGLLSDNHSNDYVEIVDLDTLTCIERISKEDLEDGRD